MKICHVCQYECEDSVELCPICGADLSGETQEIFTDEEIVVEEENAEEKETKTIENPVLLASLEDVVSAEIFKDILTENGIPYSSVGEDGDGSMRVVFGGGFSAEEIYVDSADYDKANELYSEFLESESKFDGEFFEGEFEEEE